MTEYLTTGTKLPPYMIFPRFLLDSDLSETTKLLYMLLLDRARLSMKNDGWTDAQGHVFIYFTITDLAAALHKGEMTIKNSLAALESCGLIVRKRQGAGFPNRIYVKIPSGPATQTDRKLSGRETENCPMDRQKIVPVTDRKLSGNKKEINKNHSENKRSKAVPAVYGKYQNVFLTENELCDLKRDVPDWQQYIEKLSSYMASSGKTYQNHAATIRSWVLRDKPASTTRNYDYEEGESL
ncbi:MAG: replication initiator protein A [Lachnospiraceae bacterium]|nr:replication initiator protein A [Lachnospiraceae bacterium]